MIKVEFTEKEIFNLVNVLSVQAQINEELIPLYVKLAEIEKEEK